MDKKAITLEQMEEALRDMTRWIQNKLKSYIAEPAAEGKSGYVLTTNGAGGRSWEYIPGAGQKPDKTLSMDEVAADALAVGEAVAKLLAAVENAQEAADNAQATADAITPAGIGAEKARLQFTDVTAEAFVADSTYEDFPFRAAVALEGVTAAMLPEVVLGVAEAMSGSFAPVTESYDGGVYIYASEAPEAAVTVPVITLWR